MRSESTEPDVRFCLFWQAENSWQPGQWEPEDTQTKYKGTYALLDEWRNAKAQENILIELLDS